MLPFPLVSTFPSSPALACSSETCSSEFSHPKASRSPGTVQADRWRSTSGSAGLQAAFPFESLPSYFSRPCKSPQCSSKRGRIPARLHQFWVTLGNASSSKYPPVINHVFQYPPSDVEVWELTEREAATCRSSCHQMMHSLNFQLNTEHEYFCPRLHC